MYLVNSVLVHFVCASNPILIHAGCSSGLIQSLQWKLYEIKFSGQWEVALDMI